MAGPGQDARLGDPDYLPPLSRAIPLAVQHVLAMFVANVTPAILVAGAAGFGPGSADTGDMLALIQAAILFAGVATLLQSVTIGPVGAGLPIVQGTSFAFLPIMIPLVEGQGTAALPALFGGVIAGGLFQVALGRVIGRVRFALPPLVTGLVVTMIGLSLIPVGIQYAAGGALLIGTPDYGGWPQWSAALVVVTVTLGFSFFGRGMLSVSAVLIGLVAGYVHSLATGTLTAEAIGASWSGAAGLALPRPMPYGISFSVAAVLGFCLMALVSAVETVGDVSAIARAGAGRAATGREITGATYADGLGSVIAGLFGSLPNTSFSQNVGLIALTRVMSRHVVTIGALLLILCGLVPKVGAVIRTIPIEVLGGGVIVMFGMVAASGLAILSDVDWSRRNMLIFAVSLSVGLGLQQEPAALAHLPEVAQVLLATGLLPAAVLAIGLNLLVPGRTDGPGRGPV